MKVTIHRPSLDLPLTVAALCAMGIVLELSRVIFILRVSDPHMPRSAPEQHAVRASHRNVPDINAIIAANLFGQIRVSQSEAAAATREPLVLTGVVASAKPASGFALIGATPSETQVYAVGDDISRGLILRSVFADHVLLERNGVAESLYLPRKSDSSAFVSLPTAAEAAPPLDVSSVFRPKFRGGKLLGFLPSAGANLAQLGLKPGDLIISVEGIALDDKMTADSALRRLATRAGASARVVGLDGEERTVLLSLLTGDR